MKIKDFCVKWEITYPTYKTLKNKVEKDLGFVNLKVMDIHLEDRLNIKKLTQKLIVEKDNTELKNILGTYALVSRFITSIYCLSLTMSDSVYNSCLLIIHEFDEKEQD